jgi:hypothetical protein
MDTDAHTSVTMSAFDVVGTIETNAGWTPEMVDDSLSRIRKQIVATLRQLGVVPTPDDPHT